MKLRNVLIENFRGIKRLGLDLVLSNTRLEGALSMARLSLLHPLLGGGPSPRLGVAGDAKGFAKRLLDAPVVRDHLEATRHFGIVKPPIEADLTRLSYVELQCSLLLRLKERYPGYGMGSKITFEGGEATGLELCQAWAVIGSWGHLWGTFATERALAFNVFHAGLADALLALIPERDRAASQTGSLHLSMYRLHECIASALLSREVDGVTVADRQLAAAAWTIYVARDRRFSNLLRASRFVRKVAFAQFHNHVGISSVGDASAADGRTSHGRDPLDGFHDAIELRALPESTPFERLLNAVEFYEYETFFSGTESATLVLEHLRAFKAWWDKRAPGDGDGVWRAIEALRRPPGDWPTERSKHALAHVARLSIPSPGENWPSEVTKWWADGKPWGRANFYISLMPRGDTAMVDIYRGKGDPHLLGEATAHVIDRLHSITKMRGRPNAAAVRLADEAAASFLVAKVHERMVDSLRLQVEPMVTFKKHRPRALANVGRWGDKFLKAAHDELSTFENKDRARELGAFIDELQKHHARVGDNTSHSVLLLGVARILSTDNREVTELDGIVLVASPNSMTIVVGECKHAVRPQIGTQTRRFADLFIGKVDELATAKTNGTTVSLWINRFP